MFYFDLLKSLTFPAGRETEPRHVIFFFFFGMTYYRHNLARAPHGCQFVDTGEEAYGQESRVFTGFGGGGCIFWSGFLLPVRGPGSGELLMSC